MIPTPAYEIGKSRNKQTYCTQIYNILIHVLVCVDKFKFEDKVHTTAQGIF